MPTSLFRIRSHPPIVAKVEPKAIPRSEYLLVDDKSLSDKVQLTAIHSRLITQNIN